MQQLNKAPLRRDRYEGGRSFLLMISVLSAVNLFTIVVNGTFFVFSSYVTQLIAAIGADWYYMTGKIVWPLLCGALGLISIAPYFLCYFLSKKRVGGMIAALVLFSVDSLLFLLGILAAFDTSLLLDLIFRTWALVAIILAVVDGMKCKKEPAPTTEELLIHTEEGTVISEPEERDPSDNGSF